MHPMTTSDHSLHPHTRHEDCNACPSLACCPHRQLCKPASLNELVLAFLALPGSGGVLKVGDFGLSRTVGDACEESVSHMKGSDTQEPGGSPLRKALTPDSIGTAAYCAPELLSSETDGGAINGLPTADAGEADIERSLKADVRSAAVFAASQLLFASTSPANVLRPWLRCAVLQVY